MSEKEELVPELFELNFSEESNINIRGALIRPPEFKDQFNKITNIAIAPKKEEK